LLGIIAVKELKYPVASKCEEIGFSDIYVSGFRKNFTIVQSLKYRRADRVERRDDLNVAEF
jgi:hypothetical protein